MTIAKLEAANNPDVMNSEEGNGSVDAIRKEPFLNFPWAGDSSVQFIQLLHALEQQGASSRLEALSNPTVSGKHEAHGYLSDLHQSWPLVSPLKIQPQKCDKCSQEFCSPINYRRHIRVDHRSKKIDKDSTQNRDMLGGFWDKLSLEDAKEVVSLKNVTLEEVSGSSIINALSSHVRKSGFSSPQHPYLKAGSDLLDIVQGRPSRFPISSQELFAVLDRASENTFLSGSAVSMQRYVFDGEAGKIGLETKKLVACTSFLLEQKLVKAWIADKNAEVLRFQKLLVEEEEAARKRQAEVLEKKKQKKLRQKERKAKDQQHGEKADIDERIDQGLVAMPQAETLSQVDCDSHIDTPDMPDQIPSSIFEQFNSDGNFNPEFQMVSDVEHVEEQSQGEKADIDESVDQGLVIMLQAETSSQVECDSHIDTPDVPNRIPSSVVEHSNYDGNLDPEFQTRSDGARVDSGNNSGDWQFVRASGRRRRQQASPKSQRVPSTSHHAAQSSQASKLGVQQNRGTHWDPRTASTARKVWNQKAKPETEGDTLKARLQKEALNEQDQIKNREVLIGSVAVTVRNCSQEGNNLSKACDTESQMPKNSVQVKPNKPADPVRSGTSRPMVMFWRPKKWKGIEVTIPIQDSSRASEVDNNAEKGHTGTLCSTETGISEITSDAVKAFLAERWKETTMADHVKLVLTPDSEPIDLPDIEHDTQETGSLTLKFHRRSILGDAENRLVNVDIIGCPTAGVTKAKFRTESEEGVKKKDNPKERTIPT
ncbi:Zinc finger, C2H [Trema orientale]|uniref:Zinc finger, C2H n=1 Tax=Trema orientale TaxID=63057 RepID=A0A2P5B5Y3_TREOI|nr:Zinc finger, C2H [Trema orientale]